MITMERIIPLFAIASLNHDRYPGMKSRCLAGNVAMVNYYLLELSSILSRVNIISTMNHMNHRATQSYALAPKKTLTLSAILCL